MVKPKFRGIKKELQRKILKKEFLDDLFEKNREIDLLGSKFKDFGKVKQALYKELTPVMKQTIKYFEDRDVPYIDKTNFWKWFRETRFMKSTRVQKKILPGDERMMEEQFDTLLVNIIHGHMTILLWLYAAPEWIVPNLKHLIELPSGPGFDELQWVIAMIMGGIAGSATINFFASITRALLHQREFKKYAERHEIEFVDLGEMKKIAKKYAKTGIKELRYNRKYESFTKKIRNKRVLSRRQKRKYKQFVTRLFLKNIPTKKARDSLFEKYYKVVQEQGRIIDEYKQLSKKSPRLKKQFQKTKRRKENFYDLTITEQKTGPHRPILESEMEFANEYAKAFGFEEKIEKTEIAGIKKEQMKTAWYWYKKALKERGKKVMKEDKKEIFTTAMYRSFARDYQGQWVTLLPLYCFSGFDILNVFFRKHKGSRGGAMWRIPKVNVASMTIWSVMLWIILGRKIKRGEKKIAVPKEILEKAKEMRKFNKP
jgi:hypothetical protein